MRIATYNVEWFANLFDRTNNLLLDDKWSGRENVTRAQQIEALAKVLTSINADVIMVIEAPNTGHKQSSGQALENFAKAFDLRTKASLEGFANETHQEITLMYDPYVCQATHDPKGGPEDQTTNGEAPRFDGVLRLDLDIDSIHETIQFSKPPLEVSLIPEGGRPVRLIGVHVKSKVPHGARSLNEQVRISIQNRRKQMAQCIWIRKRVDEHLSRDESVIVLGDLNDGPGLDEYENLFGHSGIEVVMGCNGEDTPLMFDPNAMEALSPRTSHRPATSRFFLHDKGSYMNALLDYIMVSPDLRDRAKRWQIWHPFDNPNCYNDPELRESLLLASDHFPVTLDIDL